VPKDVPDWTTGTDIPWVHVGSHVVAGGGADSFTTTAVLPSAESLALNFEGGSMILAGFTVVGVQTLTQYSGFSTTPSGRGMFIFRINGAADSTYTIAWTGASGGLATIAAFATTLPVPDIGPVIVADSAAPWFHPGSQNGFFDKNAVGLTVLRGGVGGQSIYLFDFTVDVYVAAAGGRLTLTDDVGGNTYLKVPMDVTGHFPYHFSGIQMGVAGLGLGISMAGAGSAYVNFTSTQG
jgi:hypothetical protein